MFDTEDPRLPGYKAQYNTLLPFAKSVQPYDSSMNVLTDGAGTFYVQLGTLPSNGNICIFNENAPANVTNPSNYKIWSGSFVTPDGTVEGDQFDIEIKGIFSGDGQTVRVELAGHPIIKFNPNAQAGNSAWVIRTSINLKDVGGRISNIITDAIAHKGSKYPTETDFQDDIQGTGLSIDFSAGQTINIDVYVDDPSMSGSDMWWFYTRVNYSPKPA